MFLENHAVSSGLFRLDHEIIQLPLSMQKQLQVSSQDTPEIFHLGQEFVYMGISTQLGPVDVVVMHGRSDHGFELFVHSVAVGILYPAFVIPGAKVMRQGLEERKVPAFDKNGNA